MGIVRIGCLALFDIGIIGLFMTAIYDIIGTGYAELRRPDPLIQKAILDGLGDVKTVVNVGAGAGSYEPTDRPVVAVELSMRMIIPIASCRFCLPRRCLAAGSSLAQCDAAEQNR